MAANLRISGAHSPPRSTSDIRVNYWDLRKVIAASNAIDEAGNQAQFYSSDGGVTSGQTTLSLMHGDEAHSGPAVDWTSDGTAWALTTGYTASVSRLRCYKSTDGGAHWKFDSTVSGTQTTVDDALMWVDHSPTSPHKDYIYAVWCVASDILDGYGACFVGRRAGPGGNWETPVHVGALSDASDITTNSVGDVFAFSKDVESQTPYVSKSTDGGGSFAKPVVIAATDAIDVVCIPATGPAIGDGDEEAGVVVYISGGAFRDSENDLVYALWFDLNSAADCTGGFTGFGPFTDATSLCKSRIWFSRSIDGGKHWEIARKINHQTAKNDQFNPQMVVDETSGELMAIYYDTINDAKRIKTDVWMQHLSDHGSTWSHAVQISARCLIPGFDGAPFSPAWRDALWARFSTAAPRRQRRSVERYNIVKRG